ncbi:MAG: hypothetical protein IIC74_09745, partial [Bacteroidetes bacterium]|nr:hypothetical protein [Bacteroidota bacterium]
IAAYFAVRGGPVSNQTKPRKKPEGLAGALIPDFEYFPGGIYAMPIPKTTERNHEENPFFITNESKPRMYVPPHINPRVIVQHSILTLHNSPEEAWETDDLIKYEIDGDSFFEIRKNLDYSELAIKVPVSYNGQNYFSVIRELSNQKFNVNATCGFSLSQLELAAQAGARFISLFYNRLIDYFNNLPTFSLLPERSRGRSQAIEQESNTPNLLSHKQNKSYQQK